MPVFSVNKKWFDVFGTNGHLVFFPLSPVPLGYRDNLSHVAPHDLFSVHMSLCVWKPNCQKSEGHTCFSLVQQKVLKS